MNILFFLKPKIEVSYLTDESTVRQGIEKLRSSGYTAIPIIDKLGRYVGTATEGDFLWLLLNLGGGDLKATEHMSVCHMKLRTKNEAVSVDAKLEDLFLKTMNQNFVPVVDGRNIFIGIITRRDVLQYFYSRIEKDSE